MNLNSPQCFYTLSKYALVGLFALVLQLLQAIKTLFFFFYECSTQIGKRNDMLFGIFFLRPVREKKVAEIKQKP
jgi:hypothetical protein